MSALVVGNHAIFQDKLSGRAAGSSHKNATSGLGIATLVIDNPTVLNNDIRSYCCRRPWICQNSPTNIAPRIIPYHAVVEDAVGVHPHPAVGGVLKGKSAPRGWGGQGGGCCQKASVAYRAFLNNRKQGVRISLA
jgi:hypothetical protein